jgi:hypothetical protein
MHRLRLKPVRLGVAVCAGILASVGVAYAASLGLSSNKLYAWNQTLTKSTCPQNYTTADDTYVQQGSPTSTSGATATTLTITGGTSGQNIGFIRFNLSGCNLPTTAGADQSILTIDITTATMHTLALYPVFTSWSSSSLNWNGVSGLSIGTTASATFTGTAGVHNITLTGDVDAAIKAGALWGWEIKDITGGGLASNGKIASAENTTTANRPSLSLSYEK